MSLQRTLLETLQLVDSCFIRYQSGVFVFVTEKFGMVKSHRQTPWPWSLKCFSWLPVNHLQFSSNWYCISSSIIKVETSKKVKNAQITIIGKCDNAERTFKVLFRCLNQLILFISLIFSFIFQTVFILNHDFMLHFSSGCSLRMRLLGWKWL